jgi:hypothetical protein
MPTEHKKKGFLVTPEEDSEIERRAKEAGKSVSNMTREFWGLPPLHHGKKPKQKEKSNKNG